MKRTIFEVLADFKDVKIPLDYMLDVFPIIMPRSFSIASAPLASVQEQSHTAVTVPVNGEAVMQQVATSNGAVATGNVEGELQWKIDLCIAIVHYKTKLWKWRTGVCTKWLKSLHAAKELVSDEEATDEKEPSQFWIRIQRGTLKLPKDPSVPLICIGPGKTTSISQACTFYFNVWGKCECGTFVLALTQSVLSFTPLHISLSFERYGCGPYAQFLAPPDLCPGCDSKRTLLWLQEA